jgi:hypothetical protein
MVHTGQLFKWLASNDERGKSVHEEHIIAPTVEPQETVAWLRWRGYRVVVAPGFRDQAAGVVFSRRNEPAFIAVVGDVLVWDGQDVRVQES